MKKTLGVSIIAILLTAGFVSFSLAGYGYHGSYMGMGDMAKLDGNGDSQITFDEFSAPTIDRLKSAFKMLDTDNDEVISKAEYDEFMKVHGYGDSLDS